MKDGNLSEEHVLLEYNNEIEAFSLQSTQSMDDRDIQNEGKTGSSVRQINIGHVSFGGPHSGTAKSTLEQHESNVRFVETQGFKTAIQKLISYRKVVLLSGYGEGKTSVGFSLLLHFVKENEEFIKKSPMIMRFPHQWHASVSPTDHVIVLLDDLCGIYSSQKEFNEGWINVFPDIHTCINDETISVYIIITMRRIILNQMKKRLTRFDLFRNLDNFLVDLSDPKNLTEGNKKLMLKTFCSYDNFLECNTEMVKDILSINKTFAFPLCCRDYFKNKIYYKQGYKFFKNPVQILITDFLVLCDRDNIAFFLLSLILFSKSLKLKFDFLMDKKNANFIQDIASFCSVILTDQTISELRHKTCELESIFLTCHEDDSVTFISDAITETIIHVVGNKDITKLIYDLDFSMLMSVTTITEEPTCKLNIEIKHLFRLLDRIITEIRNGYVQEVVASDVSLNERFIELLVMNLQKSGIFHYFIGKGRETESIFIQALKKTTPRYKLISQVMLNHPLKTKTKSQRWFANILNEALLYVCKNNDLNACKHFSGSVEKISPEILYTAAKCNPSMFSYFSTHFYWTEKQMQEANSLKMAYEN